MEHTKPSGARLTWCLKKGFSVSDGSDLIIYDAPEPWGPFSLVYEEGYYRSNVRKFRLIL